MADQHKSEMEIDDFFRNLFPESYKTEFLTQQYTDESNTIGSCQARIALKSKEDFLKWLKEHQQITGVTYRLRRTQCCKGKYSLYKADYRCHHNTLAHLNKSKQPAKKHTLCPANLSVTIKAVIENTRSLDPFLPHYPAIVTINHTHNHDIYAMEAIRHKDPSEDVKQKFIELFKLSHTPSQALRVHKKNLLEEYKGNYSMVVADRSYCPDINWVFRLYHKYYAPKSRTKLLDVTSKPAEPSIRLENNENLEANVQMKDEENQSLANIFPVMVGGEEDISNAAEILFVDSMGNVFQKCKPSELSEHIWFSYEEAQGRSDGEALIDKPVEKSDQAEQDLQREEQQLGQEDQTQQVEEVQKQQGEAGQDEHSPQEKGEEMQQNEKPEQQGEVWKDEEIDENVAYDLARQRSHMLLEKLFMNIKENVGHHYASYPDEFNHAIQTAHSNFESISSVSALINALANFGKNYEEMPGTAVNGVDADASLSKRKLSEDDSDITPLAKSTRVSRGMSEHCYAHMRPA